MRNKKAAWMCDIQSLVSQLGCYIGIESLGNKFIDIMFPRIEQHSLGSTGHINKFYKCNTPLSKLKYCNFAEEVSLIARLKKVQDFLDME